MTQKHSSLLVFQSFAILVSIGFSSLAFGMEDCHEHSLRPLKRLKTAQSNKNAGTSRTVSNHSSHSISIDHPEEEVRTPEVAQIVRSKEIVSFHSKIKENDLDGVREDIGQNPALLKSILLKEGFTPIHTAVFYGTLDMLKMLVSFYDPQVAKQMLSDPINSEMYNRSTPILLAISLDKHDVLSFILKKIPKDKINIRNNIDLTPLSHAALKVDYESLRLLLSVTPKELYYEKNREGKTFLHYLFLQRRLDQWPESLRKKIPEEKMYEDYDKDGRSAASYASHDSSDEDYLSRDPEED